MASGEGKRSKSQQLKVESKIKREDESGDTKERGEMASGEERNGLTRRPQSSEHTTNGEVVGDAPYSLPDFAPGRRLFEHGGLQSRKKRSLGPGRMPR